MKYEGFRALAYVNKSLCRLISHRGNELKRFDDLCRSIPTAVKASNAVIDGEVVALGPSGMPAFYDLLERKSRIVYFAFDLLWLDDKDLRELPLLERKNYCAQLFLVSLHRWATLTVLMVNRTRLFELVKTNDLEGLVVKRKDGKYRPQTKWYKVLNPSYSQRAGRLELFQWRQTAR